jgi:ArsR family transcriptional regulator
VSDILEIVGGSQANVSKHLSVLKRAGLVDSRRDGLNVFYQISDEGVFTICRNVCDSIEVRVDREHQTIVEGREQMNQASLHRR